MLCPSCNGFRPDNYAPCPQCNAPSPLANETWGGQNASFAGNGNSWGNQNAPGNSWGGPDVSGNNWNTSSGQLPFGGNSWQDPAVGSGIQQLDFPMPGQQAFGQSPAGGENAFWSQNLASSSAPGAEKQQSLLPVPYQGPQGPAAQSLAVGFPTIGPGVQAVNSLVPALPETGQEEPVYVPPMYTKPRPLIPRYRAVSGLISMLLVFAVLCGGLGYYAQVTGKLVGIEKFFGGYTPPSINSTQHPLAVPSNQVVFAKDPTKQVIDSVGISNKQSEGQVATLVNQFTVGETIWMTCSANTMSIKEKGNVKIKWYTNNHFYQLSTSQPIQANQSATAVFHQVFGQATEGKAEVYWNDQLEATVLFVVEPAA